MSNKQIEQLAGLLEEALSNDNYLSLPRKSQLGEPTSWVAANYENSWLKREKLLVVPTLNKGGFLIGITETIEGKAKFNKREVDCRFILDTQNGENGPVAFIGIDDCGEKVLIRRTNDNHLRSDLPDYLGKVVREYRGVSKNVRVVENDAFASFVMGVLKNKGAYGIPLGYTEEKLEQLQEESELRCLNYLCADIIVRG